jgi:hypothetical protein
VSSTPRTAVTASGDWCRSRPSPWVLVDIERFMAFKVTHEHQGGVRFLEEATAAALDQSCSVGLTEVGPDDTLRSVVERTDAARCAARGGRAEPR